MSLNDKVSILNQIITKKFDNTKVSQTPFMQWNGLELVDCKDLEKLYLSYDFTQMDDAVISRLKLEKLEKQFLLFASYERKSQLMARKLFTVFLMFIVVLLAYAYGVISNYLFYGFTVVLYLISINYPAYLKRRREKSRYLKF